MYCYGQMPTIEMVGSVEVEMGSESGNARVLETHRDICHSLLSSMVAESGEWRASLEVVEYCQGSS